MSMDRDLLLRHLRQQAELGGRELFLERLAPRDLRDILAGRRSAGSQTRAQGPAAAVRERAALPVADGRLTDPAALVDLGRRAAGCRLCRLHETRTNVVFGEGDPEAQLVVVGEAPGQEEDRTGRPFVGRAGKLLDLLLLSIGFPRASVYICNVLKCRPPQNRNPLPDEMDPCTKNFLHGQIASIAPRALLAVGKFAAQVLCASEESIGRLRGRVHVYRETPVVVTYHPAYLLRSPNMVRAAWQDLQLVRRVIDEQA